MKLLNKQNKQTGFGFYFTIHTQSLGRLGKQQRSVRWDSKHYLPLQRTCLHSPLSCCCLPAGRHSRVKLSHNKLSGWPLHAETLRVGLPYKVDSLPLIARDNSTGEFVGYYIDLATTLLYLAGFNWTFIMNKRSADKYNALGKLNWNIFNIFFSFWLFPFIKCLEVLIITLQSARQGDLPVSLKLWRANLALKTCYLKLLKWFYNHKYNMQCGMKENDRKSLSSYIVNWDSWNYSRY